MRQAQRRHSPDELARRGEEIYDREQAVIDTGFTGWITLPIEQIEALELLWFGECDPRRWQ